MADSYDQVGLPHDGTDKVTPEIRERITQLIAEIRPLSRDFARGLNFGSNTLLDAKGGTIPEQILIRMNPDAPIESDLFYLGAVIGGVAMNDVLDS